MERYHTLVENGEEVFVGLDVHKKSWSVTALTASAELLCCSIPGDFDTLAKLLDRFQGGKITVVYEAGFSGFWLYDRLTEKNIKCVVTPPSLVPSELGNKVKTDRKDSRKLAFLLSKGLLKRVWVPDPEARNHRIVARRRRQLIRDRVRVQHRIKSELMFLGFEIPAPTGRWSKGYFRNLRGVRFPDRWGKESFASLLDEYEQINALAERQTILLKELSKTERYIKQVEILESIPGFGVITAMEILLELGDMTRFESGDKLAAYVGLTPSQYSSGDKVRMGRITGMGKSSLRATLVEASWRLIGKDVAMREKYENIKKRAGAKKAIVAVARMALLRSRRILLDDMKYAIGLVA